MDIQIISHLASSGLFVIFLEFEEGIVTSTGYMDYMLLQNSGKSTAAYSVNAVRTAIKDNFKNRSCCTLARPNDDGDKLCFVRFVARVRKCMTVTIFYHVAMSS